MSEEEHKHEHFILPDIIGLRILILLLIFTFLTVVISRFEFGALNFTVAMFIATIKAFMVMLFFMGLKYDNNENRTIFFSGFVFASIFVLFTAADMFSRADIVVKGPVFKEIAQVGGSKFQQPWKPSKEIITHGKALYLKNQQCSMCHGDSGKGDGIAAGALNPKPRNFTSGDGWKAGRKPSQVFTLLTKGLGAMPSFSTLSVEDRWALVHYVLSLGPEAPKDSDADLKKVGIDTSKEDGGLGGAAPKKKLPIDFGVDRYIEKNSK